MRRGHVLIKIPFFGLDTKVGNGGYVFFFSFFSRYDKVNLMNCLIFNYCFV